MAETGPYSHLRASAGREPVLDLGDVVLMPGFINGHGHLVHSLVPPPKVRPRSFTAWARSMVQTGAATSSHTTDPILAGGHALLAGGCTTTVDHWDPRSTDLPLPGPRVVPLIEMTGLIRRRPAAALVEEAESRLRQLAPGSPHLLPGGSGLAPHALYSTSPGLVRLAADHSRLSGTRFSCHVAESAEEREMTLHGQGELAEWVHSLGRSLHDCDGVTPTGWLDRESAWSPNSLAIHANFLSDPDLVLLRERRVSVVHCPSSFDFFGHAEDPVPRLLNQGINLCIGTDSPATTVPTLTGAVPLQMRDELRLLQRRHPTLSAEFLVQCCTLNAARALGLEGIVGSLVPGAFGDIIGFTWSGDIGDLAQAIVDGEAPLACCFIGGQRVHLTGSMAQQ